MPADFHDVQFPPDISYGATGGPRYKTVIVSSESGYEQRISNWDQSRMAWEVGSQIWNADRAAQLIAFFRARKGKAFGFRFKDWSDYFVGMAHTPGVGLSYLPATQAQQIGTGNGSQTQFQLVKTYTSGGATETRKITRPVTGTVKVYVGGVDRTTGWTLDYSSGILTFTSGTPTSGQIVAWAGQFDVPARFDMDEMKLNLEGVMSGNWSGVQIVELRE